MEVFIMVVQHNLSAMNANRMLGITQGTLSSSTEKLSSGYKINRAADDAAGLSISEKMRRQIRGLTQASSNAEDGISAVQTAEGALTEVHDMLQRMNELATKAANGTYSEDDRQTIQDEITQLTTEIDRVAETTKFNESYLLKGDATGSTSTANVNAHDAGLEGTLTDKGNGTTIFTLDKKLSDGDTITIANTEYTIGTEGKGSIVDASDLNKDISGYSAFSDFSSLTMTTGDTVTYNGTTYTLTDKVGFDNVTFSVGNSFKIGENTYTIIAGDAEAYIPNEDTAPNKGEIGYSQVRSFIESKLAEGLEFSSVTGSEFKTTDYTGTSVDLDTSKYTLVSSLAKGQVSTASISGNTIDVANVLYAATGNSSLTLQGDDEASVVKQGETVYGTAEAPASAKSVYDAIKGLSVDETVTIGSGENQITYTVVTDAEVDAEKFKLTKDDILAKIHDGDYVDVNGGGAQTVVGDIASTGSTSSVISANTAYKMIAEELQKASSIGADTDATVTNNGNGKFTIKQGTVEVKDDLSFSLHVGADADMTNKITVNLGAMDAAGLGIKGLNVKDTSGAAATYAIDAIEDAIKTVSAQRSLLGAVQNRLDHTINNLDNVVENTTSAESQIRDTDMATEMVKYSNANILSQAGQSMLAQANQSNQGVLSLLG
jgi:flagellin-like hook-associated protein FlgL